MTAKRKVYVGLFVLLGISVVWFGWALYTESIGVRSPESGDTLSELAYAVWAHHPWIVLLVTNLLTFTTGFFFGHWFSAPKSVYEAVRLRDRTVGELAELKRQAELELVGRNLAR